MSPVPKGRKAATSMSLGTQTEALAAFHFDDVRTAPSPAAGATDTATYRTFDGQVIEFTGHREGDKAFVTVATRRDPALAAKFPEAPTHLRLRLPRRRLRQRPRQLLRPQSPRTRPRKSSVPREGHGVRDTRRTSTKRSSASRKICSRSRGPKDSVGR